MLRYIVYRVLQAIPVLLASTVFIFLLLHLIPGDPAEMAAGSDATEEEIEAVRAEMGLDRPLYIQYGIWVGNLMQGDLGRSYRTGRSVLELISQRIPATFQLATAGIVVALLISVPFGVMAAVLSDHWVGHTINSINSLLISVPNFWMAILFILFFAVSLDLLPPGGRVSFADDPVGALRTLILPAIILGVREGNVMFRYVRSALLDILNMSYLRTARAKGVREWSVVWIHAFPNAFIPILTILGLTLGRLLGGAVIVESVFAWPGLGRMLLDAINTRDYTLAQGVFLVMAVFFVVVNLLTDIAYGIVDPRVRLES